VSFPWIHDSEMQAARAEAELDAAGAFWQPPEEGAYQQRLDAAYDRWHASQHHDPAATKSRELEAE
jgi:hypothetical protein